MKYGRVGVHLRGGEAVCTALARRLKPFSLWQQEEGGSHYGFFLRKKEERDLMDNDSVIDPPPPNESRSGI